MNIPIVIAGFRRQYYKGVDENYYHLGDLSHGSYIIRLGVLTLSTYRLYNIIKKEKVGNIYVNGLDNLVIVLLLRFFSKYKVIYEVSDIQNVYFKKSLSFFYLRLSRVAFRYVSFFVFTSSGFVNYFHRANIYIDREKLTIIENKVHLNLYENVAKDISSDNSGIVIGYFGLLRCESTIKALSLIVENTTSISVLVAGYFIGIPEIRVKRFINLEKVKYLGEYNSPDDLPALYKKIDISWVSYPIGNNVEGNYMYARTNRFYEAGYFNVPMIAWARTFDAEIINDLKLGIVFEMPLQKAVSQIIRGLSKKHIEKFKSNFQNIHEHSFQNTEHDYKELIEFINEADNTVL